MLVFLLTLTNTKKLKTCSDPHVRVNLFLQAADLSQMLPYGLLEVQDTATLLLRVTGDLQLETHTLLSLTVFLQQDKDQKTSIHSFSLTIYSCSIFI